LSLSEDIKITPMLKQYIYWKKKYPDCLLFFRVGDFYELFFDDARTASAELDIVLTTRSKDQKNAIPMAGVPYHAVDSYLSKLVSAGYRVAICEQMTEPDGKTIVKRSVTRVVTPGTWIPENADNDARIIACYFLESKILMAFLESGSGVLKAGTFQEDQAFSLLSSFAPNEIVISKSQKERSFIFLKDYEKISVVERDKSEFTERNSASWLCRKLNITTVNSMGFDDFDPVIGVVYAAIRYLEETQFAQANHISAIIPIHPNENLILDRATQINLELIDSNNISLYSTLNKCKTPMGKRKLKEWILAPLQDIELIKFRQDSIDSLINNHDLREKIKNILPKCRDMAKSLGRLTLNLGSPSDLLAIKQTLQAVPIIKNLINSSDVLSKWGPFSDLSNISQLLNEALSDSVPRFVRDGGTIRTGYNKELDKWRERMNDSSSWLAKFEEEEREKTGIKTLKTGVNRIFGYFIEIPKGSVEKAPLRYIRKQTLVSAERYITEELKIFEKEVFMAEEEMILIEEKVYIDLIDKVMENTKAIQEISDFIATIDVLISLADIAFERGYTCPVIDLSRDFLIKDARHPVIEVALGSEPFTPNDYNFSPDTDQRIAIITGPNMAGKSTYLRTAALIAIMAHMGSFIPAESAKIGLIDRVFTRIGAKDELSRGQSTFMVEMVETANIIRFASERSLVILDEVGRGTSTYDGLSIAWSIIEYLHSQESRQARVLFATHYHELTQLPKILPGTVNLSMAVEETCGGITFLYKVISSPSDKSYGIEVAKLAGIPLTVLRRSEELLKQFETKKIEKEYDVPNKKNQMTLFDIKKDIILEEICAINPDSITPLEALDFLYKLKEKTKDALTDDN